MNKIVKSLYLSIIISGVIYLLLYYFSLFFINSVLLYFITLIFIFIIIFSYVSYKLPKYTKNEIIEKYNLPVKKEESLSVISKDLILENINNPVIKKESSIEKSDTKILKPKEIPKQNVNYRDYANVFKEANKSLQENSLDNKLKSKNDLSENKKLTFKDDNKSMDIKPKNNSEDLKESITEDKIEPKQNTTQILKKSSDKKAVLKKLSDKEDINQEPLSKKENSNFKKLEKIED